MNEQIIAILRLVATYAAAGLTAIGIANADENQVFTVLTSLITVATIAWSWWKNSPISKNAKTANKVLEHLNDDEKDVKIKFID